MHPLDARAAIAPDAPATGHEMAPVAEARTAVERDAERERESREARYLHQRNALITLTQSDALSSDDVLAAFRRITEVAALTLGVARVSIWRYNAERTAFECQDLYEPQIDAHSAGGTLAAADYPSYFRALSYLPVLVAGEAREDPATREFAESYLVPLGIMSMLDAPIRLGGEVDGVLCHEHVGPSPRTWTADESAFAVAMASLVSLALTGWKRRQAEASLRDSESKHRAWFEQSGDPTFLMDANGFVDCNPATVKMFGCADAAEFNALHPADLSPPYQPDGRPSRAAADAYVASALAEGQHRFEWVHRRKDGTSFPSDVCLTALTVNGRRLLLATVRDTSQRTRAEAKMRLQSAALNAAANAIVITDRGGTIAWTNPAFTALTGFEADEAIGRNPRDILKSGVHAPEFYEDLWDTVLSGQVWRGEMVNRRKDGTQYPEEQTITPVKDARGEITHFVAIKRDLTAQRQLEARMLHAHKMEAIGTLARGIAHDFNNILGALLGCAELATMDAQGNEAVLKDLAQVTAAGRRATDLVRQLLAFSGQHCDVVRPVQIDSIVAEALALLRASLPEAVTLRHTFAAGTPAVLVDPTQVHQVVMNLGINAWHALEQRPGVIDVGVDTVDADRTTLGLRPGRFVRLTVRDTGHGMSAATQARIFEPFFTTKAPGEGTGLGLSTVHGIMNKYDGGISVSSRVGEGTTFELYFPVPNPAYTETEVDASLGLRAAG